MLVICAVQFTLKMMTSAATTTIILWSHLKLDAYHQLDFFVQAFFYHHIIHVVDVQTQSSA